MAISSQSPRPTRHVTLVGDTQPPVPVVAPKAPRYGLRRAMAVGLAAITAFGGVKTVEHINEGMQQRQAEHAIIAAGSHAEADFNDGKITHDGVSKVVLQNPQSVATAAGIMAEPGKINALKDVLAEQTGSTIDGVGEALIVPDSLIIGSYEHHEPVITPDPNIPSQG